VISEDYTFYWYRIYVFITLLVNILMLASWNAPFTDAQVAPELATWSPPVLVSLAIFHMVISFVLMLGKSV